MERLDQQTRSAPEAVAGALGEPRFGGSPMDRRRGHEPGEGRPAVGGPGSGPSVGLPPGTYGEQRDASGQVVGDPVVFSYGQEEVTADPALPAHLPLGRLFTVSGRDGDDTRYRVLAEPHPSGAGTIVAAVPLREVDQTLERLLLVEALVIAGVLLVIGCAAWIVVRVGLLPLDRMGHTAGRDRGRRPLAPRRLDRLPHRGRAPRHRAQRDARPARGGLRGARGQRGAPPPLPRRRLARAAHAARLDPRLRGALSDGRGQHAGRRREGHAPDRGRGDPHGRARRGPPDAGAARRDRRAAARRARPRRPRARRRPGRARHRPRPRRRPARRAAHRGRRRGPSAAPGAREPAAQRARPHAAGDADRDPRGGGGRRGPARGPRPRPRAARRRPRRAVRALLARRGRPRARSRRRRAGARDRRRDRRRPRRDRERGAAPGGGAAFVVRLPRRPPPAPSRSPPRSPGLRRPQPPHTGL